jgi:ribonuclease G
LKSAEAPKKVLSEMSKTSTLLRDMLNASFNRIVVNSKEMYNEVRNYISRVAPDKESIVQLYNGRTSVFDQYDVTKQIKSSFGRTVNMKSGAYLVIEHTEAMHVIDVNSGHQVANDENQEANAMKVNMEAAKEVARQLRLRDIGGIIIVDFIDVRSPENKRVLNKTIMDSMRDDKARHTILPMSRFGLLQITRQRVKPEINITTDENCPACDGTGKIGPSILLMDEIEKNLNHIITANNQKKITLFVHPYVEAYIRQGFPSRRMRWWGRYRQWVNVDSSDNIAMTEYHFYDKNGEEILMN